MATSSSRDFDLDVAEIIEEAYERCGLEVRTGYDAKSARRSMNLMFALITCKMMDDRSLVKRDGYKDYMDKTNQLLIFPKKRL